MLNKLTQKKSKKALKPTIKSKLPKKSMDDGFDEQCSTILAQIDEKEATIEAEHNNSEAIGINHEDFNVTDESSVDEDDSDYTDEVNIV